MMLLEFSMSPLGKGESVGKYVARSLDIIDTSGVNYRLNPMGTVLEGEWDEVFGVVKQCYEIADAFPAQSKSIIEKVIQDGYRVKWRALKRNSSVRSSSNVHCRDPSVLFFSILLFSR